MISKLLKYKFKYFLNGSKVIVESGATLVIDSSVKIDKSNIYVGRGAYLKISSHTHIVNANIYIKESSSHTEIGSHCQMNGVDLALWNGKFIVRDYSILENGSNSSQVRMSIDGECKIGEYNRIRAGIGIRFGGKLNIGNHNAINEFSEIRCDEKIEIGDYNQISYHCDIWDTNTHCMYEPHKRRELTDSQYPGFGEEIEKPESSPIEIGDDCWIAKNCTIFKGTNIGNNSIVGYGTLISGKKIPENSTVISKSTLQVFDNKELN